jgi:hypothetical protein
MDVRMATTSNRSRSDRVWSPKHVLILTRTRGWRSWLIHHSGFVPGTIQDNFYSFVMVSTDLTHMVFIFRTDIGMAIDIFFV